MKNIVDSDGDSSDNSDAEDSYQDPNEETISDNSNVSDDDSNPEYDKEEEGDDGEYDSNDNTDEDDSDVHEASDGDGDIDKKIEDCIYNFKDKFSHGSSSVSNTPTSIRFSPTSNRLCVGCVNGDIEIFEYSNKIEKIVNIECYCDESCTALDFSKDGNSIFVISPSQGAILVDVVSQDIYNFNSLHSGDRLTILRTIDDNIFCTGDDCGSIKCWDIRQIAPTKNMKPVRRGSDMTNDYISDILFKEDSYQIASASGSGVITVFDIRTMKSLSQCNHSKSDLTSLTSALDEEVIVGGALNGDLVFSYWSKSNVSQKSHTYEVSTNVSCNDVTAVSSKIIISAWEDNFLRIHSIFPHEFEGFLGKHTMPPEQLDVSNDNRFVASTGYDKIVHLWDISELEEEMENINSKKLGSSKNSSKHLYAHAKREEFFDNLI